MRLTIKIGSNVLTRKDGSLDITRMSALVDQIAELRNEGHEIILVSSGAVASGRSELEHITSDLDSVDKRHHYFDLFRDYGINVGQVLTTKENFSDSEHRKNQENCIRVMLENEVIPIVNENDTVSITELMFTDNDELSGLIAQMTQSQTLIILSNIDGIYNGDPADKNNHVIRTIEPGRDISDYIQTTKSSAGRGGMQSKSSVAQKTAKAGINVIIANGKRENILTDLMNNRENTLCTEFLC